MSIISKKPKVLTVNACTVNITVSITFLRIKVQMQVHYHFHHSFVIFLISTLSLNLKEEDNSLFHMLLKMMNIFFL
jgi:hypothetical protein